MKPDLLQSRQKGSVEAELAIFGNEGRVLVEKPIFRSLAVKIERMCRSETANLWKSRQRCYVDAALQIFASQDRAELHIFGSQGRAEVRKRSFTLLAVNAERKCGRSQGRAEMRKRYIRSLAVKAEQKCGSGISDL